MKRLTAVLAVVAVILIGSGIAYAASMQFRTELSGGSEVPVRVTGAEGDARFKLDNDGEARRFRLKVDDVENLWMAHIHLAPAGSNGPIVVWLFPQAGPPPPSAIDGVSDGRVADGRITAEDLVGPLAGQSLSELVAQMEAGNTYVNVHTNDFVDPPNTGPGDFPGGEIRGQIHEH